MSRLASLLKIRPGEGRLVALLMVVLLLPNLGAAAGSPAVESLFYARFGVENLPVMYIALGIVTMLVTMVLAGALGRVSKKRLYLVLPPILGLTLAGSRLLVAMDLRWFYPVLWLWMAILWTLQGLFSWGLAGMVCDTRQAKRLFPLFGAGGILGMASGALLTRPLVGLIGTENLLWVWAGALLAVSGLVFILLRQAHEPRRPAWRRPPGMLDEVRKGYYYVRRTGLMRWVSLATALLALLFFSLSFPVAKAISARFPNEDDLAGFIGVFQGAMTGTAFLVSLFAANRVFARIGFINGLLVLSFIYMTGFAAMLTLTGLPLSAAFGFTAIILFRYCQSAWGDSVGVTAFQALFNIVPASQREQTRSFVNGVPYQLGVSLTGVILILGVGDRQLFWIGIGAAGLTALALWRAGKAYRAALADALRAGQPHLFYSEEIPFGGFQQDAHAVETAIRGISDPNPAIRMVSAEILGYMAVPQAGDALAMALEDFDAGVRAAALQALVSCGRSSALLEVAASLQDDAPMVRLAAVQALAALATHPRGLRIHLSPLLDDPDPRVRAHSAATLLQTGEHPAARSMIYSMAVGVEPEARASALEALAGLQVGFIPEVVAGALTAPQPAVRRAAARLASSDPDRCLLPLVQSLDDLDSSVRRAIAESLGRIGTRALPLLQEALDDPRRERGALLAYTYLPAAQAAAELRSFAAHKVTLAGRYGSLWGSLSPQASTPAETLLCKVLLDLARQQAGRGLQALGLLDDPTGMQVTLENLTSPDSSQRANAIEMLDSIKERRQFEGLLYLWDSERAAQEVPSVLPTVSEVLLDLLDGDGPESPWLCASALLAAREVQDPAVRRAAERYRQDPDPLIAETASYAISGADMDTLDTIPIMERILYLQKVHLFEDLAPADLKQIAAITGEHLFPDGERIVVQGQPGDEMYIIVKGEVDVVHEGEDGERKQIARRVSGDYVGEMSIISHEPRTATLIASGQVRALCLEQKSFEALLRERPEVSLAVMKVLIERLKEASLYAPVV